MMESIPEFFKNKNVFITGGSGFVGKVLVEKLLRSCPEIGSIYLIMRPKKGITIEERMKTITDQPLFDLLRSQNIENFKKIKIVNGDVQKLGLGLCDDDRQILIKEVNIVFHGAASVRFDDPLIDAILMNTRGARETVNLALQMKNLQIFVHISTTYCHTDNKVVEEIMYPPMFDWRKSISLAENADPDVVEILTPKLIEPLPNTYTFTKNMSEHVVYDLCSDKLPLIIVRPSIVISTAQEPVVGWVDNFNGPVGLLVAAGKGIVRVSYNDPNTIADYIPVDLLVKGMIIAAWKKVILDDPEDRLKPTIYNGSSNKYDPMSVQQIADVGTTLNWEYPLNTPLWYPAGISTRCWYHFYVKFIFYQFIPAMIIDGLLKVAGYKPFLTNIQRKIYSANMAVHYFLLNEWTFENNRSFHLDEHLLEEDRRDFSFHREEINAVEYFTGAVKGGRKYLMKEPDSTLQSAKNYMKKLWILYVIFNVCWYLLILWIVFIKFDALSIVVNKIYDAQVYFTED